MESPHDVTHPWQSAGAHTHHVKHYATHDRLAASHSRHTPVMMGYAGRAAGTLHQSPRALQLPQAVGTGHHPQGFWGCCSRVERLLLAVSLPLVSHTAVQRR
jgi:hypothetical protein